MRSIIYGPPGTGKTTFLLNKVEEILATVPAKKVCFAAFTRRAAQEARSRALSRFKNITVDDLTHFRTLHSLAFRLLGLTQGDLLGRSDMLRFAKLIGYGFTLGEVEARDLYEGHTRGDRVLFLINMARQRRLTLEEAHAKFGEFLHIEEVVQFEKAYREYKTAFHKIDFEDVIEMFHSRWESGDISMDVSHLFIDEAQDLSLSQWSMVHDLEKVARIVYIAGDDDQAIFSWAGADVNHFMELEGDRLFLDQSHRCSRAVHDLAHEIISPIKRVAKTWRPRDVPGSINRVTCVSDIDMTQGSWLVLTRNQFLIDRAVNHCMSEGWLFEAPGRESNDDLHVIKVWEVLRKGGRASVDDVRKVYSSISASVGVRHGFKQTLEELPDEVLLSMDDLEKNHGLCTRAEWYEALDKINSTVRNYVLRAAKMGEDITKLSRIRISTIHAAKGAEADHVVLFLDVASMTFRSYDADMDDEHRVWYVGVTRAKNSITFVDNETQNTFAGKIFNV